MSPAETIVQITLSVAIIAVSAGLGDNLFDVIVNEKNLVRNFPNSISHIRSFYKASNPSRFFQALSPVYGLIALVLFWPDAYNRRWLILGSTGCYAVTQVSTIVYFFPQNRLLCEGPLNEVSKLFNQFATTRTALDLVWNLPTLAASVLLLVALIQPLPIS